MFHTHVLLAHASRRLWSWLIFDVSQKMGRQIRFFLCDSMRASIEGEAARCGAKLVSHSASGSEIEFSYHKGEGRLWTEAEDPTDYERLCREVKRGAAFDRAAGLWVKHASTVAFDAYRKEKTAALEQLVEKNRRFAIEVLGGRPASDETKG